MKFIPQEVVNRMNEKWPVESNNTQPNLRPVATQAMVNTLISEPIYDELPGFGDVAIRQLPGDKTGPRAYALCNDNGTATVYERRFRPNMDNPWQFVWTMEFYRLLSRHKFSALLRSRAELKTIEYFYFFICLLDREQFILAHRTVFIKSIIFQ